MHATDLGDLYPRRMIIANRLSFIEEDVNYLLCVRLDGRIVIKHRLYEFYRIAEFCRVIHIAKVGSPHLAAFYDLLKNFKRGVVG